MRTFLVIILCIMLLSASVAQEQTGYIDTHLHLDGLVRVAGGWQKDYETAAENMLSIMDKHGVEKAIIQLVPTHTGISAEETLDDTLAITSQYPDRLYIMAGGGILGEMMQSIPHGEVTDTDIARFTEQAEALLDMGAIGFGEMLSMHLCMSDVHSYVWVPPDHPLFLALADIAAKHKVPIDLHMEAVPETIPMPANLLAACDQNPDTLQATIPALERLLDHNPDAKIVWQHIGWDNVGFMTVELLHDLLHDHPNLYLSLRVEERPMQVGGGRLPMPNRIVDNRGEINTEWLLLMLEYPDRIMIGADEFIGAGGQASKGAASFDMTWTMFQQLHEDLIAPIGYENAARVYKLKTG